MLNAMGITKKQEALVSPSKHKSSEKDRTSKNEINAQLVWDGVGYSD